VIVLIMRRSHFGNVSADMAVLYQRSIILDQRVLLLAEKSFNCLHALSGWDATHFCLDSS
jgi:hypothetical protein